MSFILIGCAAPPRPGVPLEPAAACPDQPAANLAVKQNQFGPHSSTETLECTLALLRDTSDPSLLRSPLASRTALLLAERNPDAEQREALALEGVRLAEKAVASGAEGDGAVHYYLAANLGLAVRDNWTAALENLPRLEQEMKRAVELNPEVDSGGPLRLLGMLYLEAPPWPTGIGDGDKALALLKRAVEQFPGHPLNHLFYAKALWEVEGEAAAAQTKAELATARKLMDEGNWGYSKDPWNREFAEVQQEVGTAL